MGTASPAKGPHHGFSRRHTGDGRMRRCKEEYRVPRYGVRDGRCHDRQSSPSRTGCKRGTQSQAIGRLRGGMSAKILALCDALGNLVKFVLMPGQRHDSRGVRELIDGMKLQALLADKAFDADWLIQQLQAQGVQVVISQMPARRKPLPIDEHMYRWRHLIENFFGKLKEFKRIAMRSDKTGLRTCSKSFEDERQESQVDELQAGIEQALAV
ncbi:IS5 family transposase, partial [Comamonadaceae bacterium OH2545_COT-014]